MLGNQEPGGGGGSRQAQAGEESSSPGQAPAGCRCRLLSLVVNWRQRPCRTSALFAAANTVICGVAFSPLRAFSLLAVLLALLVVTVTARDIAKSRSTGAHLWRSMTASWEIIDSGQDSRSGPQLRDSLKLFLQETSAFKQQNPGKFCLLVCSLCTFFAVLGRYIPGIVISYILVLGVFLWPLMSSHEVALWLKPVLQKLDFGIGEFLQKIKENHEKRMTQADSEKEGIESDLSSMFPKLDSTVCKEMSVSDTEVSDVTWTDNGTFNLSEGHTPQTENSEDLDREEAFTGGLHEFPSLDNGATTNGDDDDSLSLGLPSPLPHHHQQPIKSKQTAFAHTDQPINTALELANQMAGDAIAAAVTAAIQERIEAAVGFTAFSEDSKSTDRPKLKVPECNRLLEIEDSDSDVEDFELLDQSELEQLEGELGLGGGGEKVQAVDEDQAQSDKPAGSSFGFFSKLLRRH